MTIKDRLDRLKTARTPWLTDGGLETSIIFHDGIDLPHFASITLLDSSFGREALTSYFGRYLKLACEVGTGFVLDTATWRAGTHWSARLGKSFEALEASNREAVALALSLRRRWESDGTPIVVNGVIGPAGDGYQPDSLYSPDEAKRVHLPQVRWLADAGVDILTAVTFTHTGEALGFVHATRRVGIPCVVSFTVETDGRLPTGQTLREAIAEVDAASGAAPLYYMVNCAHPDHFAAELEGDWTARIGGIRANASRQSHAELDAAEDLDEGDPEEFGALHRNFLAVLPSLRVLGGCCGTDDRHVGCVARHAVRETA
jgi:S-methylmethionine-dependent homocysteine/selenocysteine methylase